VGRGAGTLPGETCCGSILCVQSRARTCVKTLRMSLSGLDAASIAHGCACATNVFALSLHGMWCTLHGRGMGVVSGVVSSRTLRCLAHLCSQRNAFPNPSLLCNTHMRVPASNVVQCYDFESTAQAVLHFEQAKRQNLHGVRSR
jgi:hypothetical protein